MRSLHVIDTSGPGGAETLFVELCSRLNTGGDSSVAVVPRPGWVHTQLEKRSLTRYLRECKGTFNLGYVRFLVSLIRKHEIDVIQSHLLGSNTYCALAGSLTGTPVVATFHGSVDISPKERFLGAKFALINRCSSIVSVSESLRDDLLNRTSADAKRIVLVKNGVDCSRFAGGPDESLRREHSLPPDAFVIGALGNIRPAKDYFTALRALALVVARKPNVHFMVAGDPRHALHAELTKLAAELGIIANTHFLGFYEPPEKFLRGLDLYVLSSSTEGHPFAVMQAMAAGLPIVATRCGVESMLRDNVDSVLVPVQDPEQLARAVLELMDSPARRHQLGQAARQHALTSYDLAVTEQRYRELYQKAMGAPG